MWTCEMPNDDAGTARNWMALYMCIVSKSQITAGRALVEMEIMSKNDYKSKKVKESKPVKHNERKIFSIEETEEIYNLFKSGTTIEKLANKYGTNKNALRSRLNRYKKKVGLM